ncbi:MAG: transposase [Nitrospira sp.]|nr:transposase [Nitrospira sp.]
MKLAERMTTKTRRRYTDVLNAEAVRVVRDSARPVAQVVRDLGIADHLRYRWRIEPRQAKSEGHTSESRRTEQEELVRLRRENVTLNQERNLLRRAAAFFSKESRLETE